MTEEKHAVHDAGKRPDAGASAARGIDEQVDEVIKDIESNSSFMLRKEPDAEVFDPGDIHPDDLAEDVDLLEDDFAGTEAVDELADGIEVAQEQQAAPEPELTEEEKLEAVESHRRRLRTVLIVFVVILVLIAAVIGVFIWQGSLAPDVKPSDTEALATGAAGKDEASFAPVENKAIPQLATVYGKTVKQARSACGSTLVIEGKAEKARDSRVKAMTKLVNGKIVDENGAQVADVAFGLNKKSKIVYVYCSFDLDQLEVADATFEDLVASDVVPRSLLEAVGVKKSALESAALTVEKAPKAVTSQEGDAKQQAVFKGSTGLKGLDVWQLTETYDQTVGQTLGDNSVMRTLLVELY